GKVAGGRKGALFGSPRGYASNAAPAPFTPPGSFPRKRGKRSKSAPSVTARQLPPLRRGSETNPFPRRRGKRNQSLPLRSGIEHGPQAGRGWPLGTKPIEIPSPQAGEAEQNPHQPLRVDPSAAPHLRNETLPARAPASAFDAPSGPETRLRGRHAQHHPAREERGGGAAFAAAAPARGAAG